MKFLRNIFRRTQAPLEETPTGEPTYPTNESVSEIDIDPNDFDQLQDVVDAQEIYDRAAEYGRAKTFVEQNKWRLPVAQIGIYGGHTLSALTMLGFAMLASWKWTGVADNPNMENYLIAGVSAVVLLLMTLLVETIKVNGESSMFDAWAFGRKFPISRKIRVMATILISLGVSSGGSYLFGLYYTDNSAQINAQNQVLASQTTNTFRSDSLRLENNYTARKAQLEKDIDFYGAISQDNPFLIRVKWKGGQQFLKEDWKLSPAGRQTVTDKETELAGLIADFPSNLKNLRNEHTGDIQGIQQKLTTELQTDASKAQIFGIYAIIIATIVEILSLVCHFLKADFMKRARSEGLAAGMIQQPVRRNRISMEAIMVQTMRKQAMQLARELEEIKRIQGNTGSLPTPPTPPPSGTSGDIWETLLDEQEGLGAKGEEFPKNRDTAGVRNHNPTPNPSLNIGTTPHEISELKEVIEELKLVLKSGADFTAKTVNESPGGVDNKTVIRKREISVGNTHPEFTEILQPDTYRDIDKKLYGKFLKSARSVLNDKGRYNQSEIARRSGISRPAIIKYLKIAIEEKGDLPATLK